MTLTVVFEGCGARECIITPAPRGLEALDFARKFDHSLTLKELKCEGEIIASARLSLTEEQARNTGMFTNQDVVSIKIENISKLGAMYRKWEYDPIEGTLFAIIDPEKIFKRWEALNCPTFLMVVGGVLHRSAK